MNGNLSKQQVSTAPAVNKIGVMPIKPKYDGPAPIKEDKQSGVLQPNKQIIIPKPGFF